MYPSKHGKLFLNCGKPKQQHNSDIKIYIYIMQKLLPLHTTTFPLPSAKRHTGEAAEMKLDHNTWVLNQTGEWRLKSVRDRTPTVLPLNNLHLTLQKVYQGPLHKAYRGLSGVNNFFADEWLPF